ncbi:MAG: DUF2079 domain-containing protein [candidate division Zixibacteria bacterium]|nr:DUF2079 domain-containing protein [candidate division Zixibacteria bacterium]
MQLSWRGKKIPLRNAVLTILIIAFMFTTFSHLARHFNFKTAAYDTGIQAGVARNLAFEGSFYNEVMEIDHRQDHFAPALALPGLLFYIWDNAAVVFIFQNICIFLSIILAYYLARKILKNELHALLLSFFYAVNYYLTAINNTDFHIDTLAVPLLLILLLLSEKRQTVQNLVLIALVSLAMLLIKEDLPLTVVGLGIFVMIFRKNRRAGGVFMLLIGGIGFYLIMNHFMLRPSGEDYIHINYYKGLGDSMAEAVKNILTRPDIVIKNLVTPPEKILRLFILLSSFMLLPIFAPIALCSAAAPLFYQLVSSYDHQYRFHAHYSAPAIPFLFYASVYGFKRAKTILLKLGENGWSKTKNSVLIIAAVMLALSAIITIGTYAKNIIRYDHELYQTFETRVKPLIKPGSRVISTGPIQPHFIGYSESGRLWKTKDLDTDHDFVVISIRQRSLTLPDSVYRNYMSQSKKQYETCYEDSSFMVFRISDTDE